jgi:hypothetical protein
MTYAISASHLFSYCPSTALLRGARSKTRERLAASVPMGVRKSGRERPDFLTLRQRIIPPLQRIPFPTAPSTQSLCWPNRKTLVSNRGSGFTGRMICVDRAGSKLSAWDTRQQGRRLFASPVVQLGKGETPIASPVCRLRRHAETMPVSAPFGLCRVVAPSSLREARR